MPDNDAPDTIDEELESAERTRRTLLGRLARRLRNPGEIGEDAMELLGVVAESSDRAKTEMVRMVAREARHYLEELRLKDDLRALVTGHSLEVHLSLSLKPLEGVVRDDEDEEPPKPKRRRRRSEPKSDADSEDDAEA